MLSVCWHGFPLSSPVFSDGPEARTIQYSRLIIDSKVSPYRVAESM